MASMLVWLLRSPAHAEAAQAGYATITSYCLGMMLVG